MPSAAENPAPPRWLLYRIDDNGNEVAMRAFEARGHKQAYLVRRDAGAEP